MEENPDPDLGHGPRRLRAVLALLAAATAGGVTGMLIYERLTASPTYGLGRMLNRGAEIGGTGAVAGAFLGVLLSLLLLALDAKGRGPRTVWGWVLVGFHVPVALFVAAGLLG